MMPVSSLFLGSRPMAKLVVLSLMSTSAFANSGYQLQADYSGATFFDYFDFATGNNNGDFVDYVDMVTAYDDGEIASDNTGAYLMPDTTTVLNPNGVGRASIKLVSTQTWTHGLFITDLNNMPGGVCGVEAKHYLAGVDLSHGEIDIISGYNNAAYDQMTLFTQSTCPVTGSGQIGTSQSTDCSSVDGCSVLYDSNVDSFGANFNNNDGGVFATQWESGYIRIWFFDSGKTPADIVAGTPDPSLWGEPVANFQGSCNIDGSFSENSIVFDMDFCSNLAEANWAANGCNSLAPTCREYVADFPANINQFNDFQEVYWGINSIKVYQLPQVISLSSASPPATSSTSRSSSSIVIPTSTVLSSTSSEPSSSSVMIQSSSVPAPVVASSSSSSFIQSSASVSALPSSSTLAIPSSIVSSTSSPAPSSTVSPLSPYKYYGCIEEGLTTRILFDGHELSSELTLESCASFCVGFTYFGTEYGDECYCGDSFLAPVITAPDSDCWMACAGNSAESCGGPDRLSVYALKAAPVVASSSIVLSSTSSSSRVATSTSISLLVSSSTANIGLGSSTAIQLSASSIVGPSTAQSSAIQSTSTASSKAQSSDPGSSSPLTSATSSIVAQSPVPSSSAVILSSSSSSAGNLSLSSSTTVANYSPTASSSAATVSSAPLFTISTVYATTTYTITSCAATVTDCPLKIGQLTTETISLSTISVPVISVPSSTAAPVLSNTPVYSVSTVYRTTTYTITSCAASVTNCPARIGQLTTETTSMYTTNVPVTAVYSVSTVYRTTIYTITSCAASVTDCPARIGQLTTETVFMYTTNVPVTKAPASMLVPIQSTQGQQMYTTVIVTTYVDICPTGYTTKTASTTLTLPVNTAGPVNSATIAFTTKAATVTLSGTTITMQLTLPMTTPPIPANTILSTVIIPPVPVNTELPPGGVSADSAPNSGPSMPPGSVLTAKPYPASNSTMLGASGTAAGTGLVPSATGAPYSAAGRFRMSFGAGVIAYIGLLVVL